MRTLTKITLTETKLALRSPAFVISGLVLPTAIMAVLGAIPAIRTESKDTPGMRFLDAWVPSMVVLTIAMMGLQSIPGIIATYREQGILRRFATTPVHPAKLLVAQLIINVTVTIGGVGVLLVAGTVFFDVPGPRHPLGFLLTFVLGTAAIFGLGLIAASVAKTSRAAGGIAMIAYLPIMFLGGVYLPRPLLPEAIQNIGAYIPPGVKALEDAWTGSGAQPLQLAVLAAFAVGSCVVATKLFRWE
ncbi:ABC transporter permease [Amycolatopsis regifaucium]|uniref:Transport permease protein n=1 Tax=Amycolatopsis regifaucium TaxID=546365 RepID=A0A154MQK8_9PSEU|nr:ABC transporter permease [Amycolatopsis regifaucium]KZB86380.1 ABC transporter [Amycolatopsis regifaucium]OKA06430.1 ABC transporter [Amycolatopsis regifaucium]SFJ27597.1 ABC-2 type transport system permease protein [Amycolatopsis regifaucium]